MVWLTLVRHGESQWNQEQRFTGWADVPLTPRGIEQMRMAGAALRQRGLGVDVAYTSALTRCVHSLEILLEAMGRPDVPRHIDWRLNERHYGALTGRLKAEAEQEYGAAAVRHWRRAYDGQPPAADEAAQARYRQACHAGALAVPLPSSESLCQTVSRVSAAWRDAIAPALRTGASVIVVAHGNSLRALTMLIEKLSSADVVHLEIGNGEPCLYELDAALAPITKHILAQAAPTRSEIL
ncbi:hypothetical protein CAL29_22725 [Bordetella genomosp. 10]|uniref:2,3-bisphosphoglycerate-dependent phosphoglycerate mutase n=1 Tax=Bordetella genomosp. 10 TaxID=1416804 RepID=A0A261S0C8_9BORD|nr:2,3-diphosphoglycerate-dependent phosphoglycerate mutase [Bordetella genomosp. 10]OZI30799.1 hypothetical protein CAL29_22725 [Bordetella genomosp. 10]